MMELTKLNGQKKGQMYPLSHLRAMVTPRQRTTRRFAMSLSSIGLVIGLAPVRLWLSIFSRPQRSSIGIVMIWNPFSIFYAISARNSVLQHLITLRLTLPTCTGGRAEISNKSTRQNTLSLKVTKMLLTPFSRKPTKLTCLC